MRKKAPLIFLIIFLSAFIFLAVIVLHIPHLDFDLFFQSFAASHRSHTATRIMGLITFFGSHSFLFPAYIILALLYLLRKKLEISIVILAIGITSTLLLFALKEIFKRPRPLGPILANVRGYSFPSGHTFSSFIFFGLCAYLILQSTLAKNIKIILSILLFFFAWMIGYSRIYFGVHYPSDVLAGFALSASWLMISLIVIDKVKKRRNIMPGDTKS